MNTLLPEAVSLAKEVAEASKTAADDCSVAVCAPLPYLTAVKDALAGSKVGLGAQDCYTADAGAFTGAVSTGMLESVGCDYVLSGHSERRATFGDSDEDVNAKTLKILDQGLKCILCIGELKEERESGETFNVCNTQLTKGLKGVSAEMMKDIVIAYEPVWAIGTGLTATPEVAQETHAYIRSWFVENYSQDVADSVIIQYGDFGDIMIDYSYVECSMASNGALARFREAFPTHRQREVDRALARGNAFLKSIQREDGSWYGSWGCCFTYAGWFGIEGLVDSG